MRYSAPTAPYTSVVTAGPLAFVSGQVGLDPETGLVADGFESQLRLCLRNIERLLDSVGMTRDNVVRTTVYLARTDDFPVLNDIYVDFFRAPRPTRTTIGIGGMVRDDLLVEVDAIAYLPSRDRP